MTNKLKMILMVLLPLFTIIGCSEDAPIETTGGITVVVTEAGNNEPVAAAIVTLAGISQSHSTGTDGKVEITDLEEKTYIVKVKKEGYQADSKQVTIQAGKSQALSFSLKRQVPKLKVTPTEIVFAQEDTEKVIEIANENDAAKLTWSISGIPNWLTVSKQSGMVETTPQNITLKIDRSKMNDGENKATLIVKATNGKGSAEIAVTATKKVGQLAADPTSVNFGSAETSKSITLKNVTQVGTISYKLLKKPDWVKSISNAEGTLTKAEKKTLIITVDRNEKAPATYEGTIQFSSNKNTVSVAVYMTVVAPSAPEVSITTASEITHNSMKVKAKLTAIGSENVTSYGFCWSQSPNPTSDGDGYHSASSQANVTRSSYSGDYSGSIDLGATNTPKDFEHIITNLAANTLYYIRSYATNKIGTTYGNQIQITTLKAPTLPTVNNTKVENVEATMATFSAYLESTGNVEVTEYGFCYSNSNNTPTINDTKVSLGATSNAQPFTKEITDLQEETTYHMRAFATNSMGTSYSNAVQFTTKTAPPAVTNGLLAYYTFDQENADDYLGNEDYNGVLYGGGNNPTFTTETPSGEGKAAVFKSYTKHYRLISFPDKNNTSFTYSVWVKKKLETTLHYDSYSVYLTADKSNRNYRMIRPLAGRVGFGSGTINRFDIKLTDVLFNNKWHHLVVTSTDGNTFRLYIDGRFYEEKKVDKIVSAKNATLAKIGYGYLGSMDNLRIYNRALTKAEIKKIYKAKQ